jgi:hypothetical protein
MDQFCITAAYKYIYLGIFSPPCVHILAKYKYKRMIYTFYKLWGVGGGGEGRSGGNGGEH